MDVNDSLSRREIERAKRLLRDREEAHQRELNSLKENQEEQLAAVERAREANLEEIKERRDEEAQNQRERFDNAANDISDKYERKLYEERKESYDKYARLNEETQKTQRAKDDVRNRQIKDYVEQAEKNANKNRDAIEDAHRDNFAKLKKSHDAEVAEARKNFDRSLAATAEDYEKKLKTERTDNDEKFAKLSSDSARERARDNYIRNKQFKDYVSSQKTYDDKSKLENERHGEDLRLKFDKDRVALKDHYDEKFKLQKRDADEALSETAMSSREKIDTNTRRVQDDFAKQKYESELRNKQIVDDSVRERASMKRAFDVREQELLNQNRETAMGQAAKNAQANEDYRASMNEKLMRNVNDNNFITSLKERDAADKLAVSNQEHRAQEKQIESQFRKNELDLKNQIAAEKERSRLKESLDERRHKQDTYLAMEGQRKANNLNADVMRSRYKEKLYDLDQENLKKTGEVARTMQKRVNDLELRNLGERSDFASKKAQDDLERQVRHNNEKHRLVRSYEAKTDALEEQNKRQIDETKLHLNEINRDTKTKADKFVSQSSRENQEKVYKLNQNLKNTVEEMDARLQQERDESELKLEQRSKRLASQYNRSLMTQKERFDEASEETKSESAMQQAKLLGESEYQRRVQLMDLQMKNRVLINNYESKINELKDDHEMMLAKMKQDNDKEIRDTLKRTKNMLDSDRAQHMRELEAKDRQMQDKLKLQEETFRAQIERMKRTNELSTKKG